MWSLWMWWLVGLTDFDWVLIMEWCMGVGWCAVVVKSGRSWMDDVLGAVLVISGGCFYLHFGMDGFGTC